MKGINVILLLLLVSCEQVIDLETPDFKSKISAVGFINSEHEVRVSVFSDVGILDANGPKALFGATVTLFENDRFVGTLDEMEWHGFAEPSDEEISDPMRLAYGLDFTPTSGNEYSIEIEREGFTTVFARTVVPISSSDAEFSLTKEDEDSFIGEIMINDKTGDDFYEILVYQSRLVPGEVTDGSTSFDKKYFPLFFGVDSFILDGEQTNSDAIYRNYTFNDDLFDGKEITIPITFRSGNARFADIGVDPENRIHIELRSLTSEYFFYRKTLQLNVENSGDFFLEPVQIFSNVENGLGIFAGYQSNVWDFENE